jgi:filamentous hemagglutinin
LESNNWLKDPNPKKPLTLNKTLDFEAGRVIRNGKTASESSNEVFVLLRKDPLGPNGYRVHTSYPK